jgi:hypothetical protein
MKKRILEKIKSEKFFSHDQKKCDHEIIRDYIDLTPEKSQVIFYCAKCMEDFTSQMVPRYQIK